MNPEHVFFLPRTPGKVLKSRRPPRPPELANAAFEGPTAPPFIVWLLRRAGLKVRHYQTRSLARRYEACLRRLRVKTGEMAQALLEERPDRIGDILDVALVGVSSFFRDPEVFRALADQLESALLGATRGLRVLSAGSAGGQELYSVAMLLEEQGLLDPSELVGIDCRPSASVRAREGRFTEAQLEEVSQVRLERHFLRHGTEFVIKDHLRSRTRWETRDLLIAEGDNSFDIVLCRNVAIYLTHEGAAKLWEGVARQLRPGGLLVTGKAERPPSSLPLQTLRPHLYRMAP